MKLPWPEKLRISVRMRARTEEFRRMREDWLKKRGEPDSPPDRPDRGA
jgi:hypothetical protein